MRYKNLHQGAGLIEIIVGLYIGLGILLVAYSGLVFFEKNKRTMIAGNSALENAITGIQQIEYDIRSAGIGLISANQFNCNTLNAYYNGNVLANNTSLAPVLIQDNGNLPDKITVFYGNNINGAAPARILIDMANSAANISVNSGNSIQPNLALLATPGSSNPCTLIAITQTQTSGSITTLSHDTTSPYNPAAPAATFSKPVAYSANSLVANIGSLTWVTWQVSNDILQTVDKVTGATTAIADSIVQLQAQYGITNGVANSVQQWVDATGTWANPSASQIAQIRAIRIAITARSEQKEKPSTSTGCTTTVTAPLPWPGGNPVDLSADPNWRCYRYQTMSNIIPVKNVIWGGI